MLVARNLRRARLPLDGERPIVVDRDLVRSAGQQSSRQERTGIIGREAAGYPAAEILNFDRCAGNGRAGRVNDAAADRGCGFLGGYEPGKDKGQRKQ